MRIAILAPLEIRVPPVAYGGTELVVSLLTEELVRRGHDVTLFASGDSITTARLVPGSPRYLRGSAQEGELLSLMNAVSCLEEADRFDVIHNHTMPEGLALAGFVDTPVLTTLHGRPKGTARELFERYRGWYVTISRSARALLPPKGRFAGVIHNAIDCASYPFDDSPRDDHLLFLSRINEEKGPHLAIQLARRLGRKLVIAGNADAEDRVFLEQEVLPHVDGRQIRYVGEADARTKRELLSRASCLVAPITWDEPFGLFLAEAMACGTPVVAIRRGAVPEVVLHGETGFVARDLDEMAEFVDRVDEIDPARCRRHVEENFDVPRMADDYLAAYRLARTGQRQASRFQLKLELEPGALSPALLGSQGTLETVPSPPASRPVVADRMSG